MTTDELRAKFEAHFTPPPYEWIFTRYGKDSSWPHLYRHYDVQCAWEGWQAAHASRDAEVEALRKDAERYRWLRKNHNADLLAEDVIDEAIDAAMREESK